MQDTATRGSLTLFYTYLFWLGFFAMNRTMFFLYNAADLEEIGVGEILATYFHAFRLDTSAACYLLAFPMLLLIIRSLFPHKIIDHVLAWFNYTMIVLVALVYVGELGIYDAWSGSKLNYKALSHLATPDEVVNSTSYAFFFALVGLTAIISGIGIWVYRRFIHLSDGPAPRNWIRIAAFALVTPVLIGLGIRGGIQQIPINQSDVYFSDDHYILNVAAVNSPWNLFHSIDQNRSHMNYNPYIVMDHKEAEQIVADLHQTGGDSTTMVLTTDRPNVVLFILESWSSDLIASLGGYEDLTPHFDELASDGILFSNIYASGERSDQGMAAILSGYPSQPTTSIIKNIDKFNNLPSINTSFHEQGYMTSMIFGGQLNYGNIKAYMYFNEFKRITEVYDFPADIPRGKLGVHDEFIYDLQFRNICEDTEPFFSTVFTLSTHDPFDMPMDPWPFDWGGEDNGIINAVHYSDNALRDYFEEARKQPWYDNTLFIFIADHGAKTPEKWGFYTPEYRSIPMMWYGEVIKEEYRGMVNDKIGSQTDLVATLLHQMGLSSEEFRWSKDLFDPSTQDFAYYAFIDGVGWIRPGNAMAYENNLDRFYVEQFENDEMKKEMLKEGQAYLQLLFQEYLDF